MFSLLEDGMLPCAKVQTASSVVALGSPVIATCAISDDCPLARGEAVHIEWHLSHRLLPSSPAANDSSRISVVVIPSFNETRAFLTCCIQTAPCQIVGGVEIRAGCENDLKCLHKFVHAVLVWLGMCNVWESKEIEMGILIVHRSTTGTAESQLPDKPDHPQHPVL